MNEDVLKGKWRQLKGNIKERWGELTDDELTEIDGRQDVLIGKLQEKYGYSRMEAEQQLNEFLRETDTDTDTHMRY